MKKAKQLLTFLIGWPLSFLAIYFIIQSFLPKLTDIEQDITSFNPLLLGIGIGSFLSYYAFRSIVWQLLLRALGYKIPYRYSAFLWSQSEFKRYIPGNIWSFLGRTVLFTNQGVDKKDIAKALVLEVQLIFLACFFVSLLAVPFLARNVLTYLSNIPFLNELLLLLTLIGIIAYITIPKWLKFIPKKALAVITHIFPDFPIQHNFWLLFMSICALFFFGLGYYFSISAFVNLDPRYVLSLSGFFVFSLLVGLLSIITPTGLGVREGIITVGLSKIMPLSIAGFVSIMARIILVGTEILFIIISYGLYKIKNRVFLRIYNYVISHPYETALSLFLVMFFGYFISASILRYDNFYTGRFDLGNMDQTIWNTKHGRIFQFSDPDGTQVVSRLAFHADVMLVLLTPLYFLWESPQVLLITQALIVGTGAIFVYLLATSILKNKLVSLCFAFAYLMNPSIQWATLYDFHAVTLSTTLLLAAVYFLFKKHYFWFIISSLLAATTKEQVWIVVGLLGLYSAVTTIFQYKKYTFSSLLQNKKIILGFSLFVVSITLFYVLINHVIPAASASNKHFALAYFAENNDNSSTLLKSTILSPQKTLSKLFDTNRNMYLKELFLPVGYLPLLAPWYLLFPIVDILFNLMSDKVELHQIYYQYTAVITPFLYIGAIYGIYFLRKIFPKLPLYLICLYILFMSIYSSFQFSPLPWSKRPNIAMFIRPQQNKQYIYQELAKISSSYSVSSSNNLGAHLSFREHLYTLPNGVDIADIIAILITKDSRPDEKETVEKLRSDKEYTIIAEKDGFIVFKKRNLK